VQGRVIAERYELIRELGRGAIGSVWLARHRVLGSYAAVKLIRAEMALHPEARTRFFREAQLSAQLVSSHVVRVLDAGEEVVDGDRQPFIVMELLRGETLGARLERQGVLEPRECATWIMHICRAMSEAHERGLIHRDLKPGNIFIARPRPDEEAVAKVLDFGVAKVPDALATAEARTKTGCILGTPYYMSPEQAQGERDVDHRSDLWSIGVLAFECLTGTRPFAAKAIGPLVALVIAAPIPKPSSKSSQPLPAAIDAFIERALTRERDQRFQSAGELAGALWQAVTTP
jgi:eukaryotic-like serine/threonine-protein kinase